MTIHLYMIYSSRRVLFHTSDSCLASFNAIVQDVGSNRNLDGVGRTLDLDALVNNNRSQGNVISAITMTATVEAILGAVFLDAGQDLEAVKSVMTRFNLAVS